MKGHTGSLQPNACGSWELILWMLMILMKKACCTDDPLNTNGGSQNFKPYHTEEAGFDTSEASSDSTVQQFAFTNGSYTGNIYNASGSDGLNGNALNVTFGAGSQYSGAIASTSAIHVTYDGSVMVK